MNGRVARLVIVLLVSFSVGVPGTSFAFVGGFVVVGTGGVTGVYYPTGGALCRIVNGSRKDHGIRCSVEATPGSVYNANALARGDLDLGIVQSDVQFAALNGTDAFDGKPLSGLRALMSLHDEPLTIVAANRAGIESFADLEGKRVNIGNKGSGQRSTMQVLMQTVGWTVDSFSEATDLASRHQARALCDDQVDAIVFTAGHPNASIREALEECDGRLISVPEGAINAITESHPYYAGATIRAGTYPGTVGDIATFGVKATLVASDGLSSDAVYAILRAIFDDLDALRGQHPALSGLRAESMARDGLSMPMHEGAEAFFEHKGLK